MVDNPADHFIEKASCNPERDARLGFPEERFDDGSGGLVKQPGNHRPGVSDRPVIVPRDFSVAVCG
jgi:hypothetical protein